MRPLTPEETRILFEKLAKFIGRRIKQLIDVHGKKYVFRLHSDRVFYLRHDLEGIAKVASKKKLMSAGVCFGKFSGGSRTDGGGGKMKFKLHITALPYLAQYAEYKVWIKQKAEMSYVYGNHVLKAQVARVTENCQQYQGVVVYSLKDIPLGFGLMARSTMDSRRLDPTSVMVFNQADIGEYVRSQDTLFAQ